MFFAPLIIAFFPSSSDEEGDTFDLQPWGLRGREGKERGRVMATVC